MCWASDNLMVTVRGWCLLTAHWQKEDPEELCQTHLWDINLMWQLMLMISCDLGIWFWSGHSKMAHVKKKTGNLERSIVLWRLLKLSEDGTLCWREFSHTLLSRTWQACGVNTSFIFQDYKIAITTSLHIKSRFRFLILPSDFSNYW